MELEVELETLLGSWEIFGLLNNKESEAIELLDELQKYINKETYNISKKETIMENGEKERKGRRR